MLLNRFTALKLWRQTTIQTVKKNDNTSDLTARQMAVLLNVYLLAENQTVRSLAEELNITKPAVTRAIDKLSTLNLVKRQVDENDRRSVYLTRTVEGAIFVSELGEEIVKQSLMIENTLENINPKN